MEWLGYTKLQLGLSCNGRPRKRAVRTDSLSSASSFSSAIDSDHTRFAFHKPYYLLAFAIFIGCLFPIPFWIIYKLSPPESRVAKIAKYINTPIVALYVGWLPYSVNGQWWYVLAHAIRVFRSINVGSDPSMPGLAL